MKYDILFSQFVWIYVRVEFVAVQKYLSGCGWYCWVPSACAMVRILA
jgi:hypothetical protein